MRIIKYIDRHGASWWTSAVCEHCGQDIHKTVGTGARPWKCAKGVSVTGCGNAIQPFDTQAKAEAYYNPKPSGLSGYHPTTIITDDPTPVPLPTPPEPAKPPIDFFAINKEFASH